MTETTTSIISRLTDQLRPMLTGAEWAALNGKAIFEGWTTAHLANEMRNLINEKSAEVAPLMVEVHAVTLEQMARAARIAEIREVLDFGPEPEPSEEYASEMY
jgi:hypothetical protein